MARLSTQPVFFLFCRTPKRSGPPHKHTVISGTQSHLYTVNIETQFE